MNYETDFVSFKKLEENVSEYVYFKFVNDVAARKILRSENCSGCGQRLAKVIDFMGNREVEACYDCKRAWLKDASLLHIKSSQNLIDNKKPNYKMPSSFDKPSWLRVLWGYVYSIPYGEENPVLALLILIGAAIIASAMLYATCNYFF